MERSWLIGAGGECDLVVALPQVSSRHARLWNEGAGYSVEDLDSTNGVYRNGSRIAGRVAIVPGDAITLGLTTPLPWPSEAPPGVPPPLRIGRDPDNDVVIDAPMVSSRHAELFREGPIGEATIRDLGSANGTAIGAADRKVDRARVVATDTIYLGTHAIAAIHLLARLDRSLATSLPYSGRTAVIGRDPGCDRVADAATISGRHARLAPDGSGGILVEDLGSSNGTFVNAVRIDRPVPVVAGDLISLGGQAFLLAVESGRPPKTVASPAVAVPPPTIEDPGLARPTVRGGVAPAILLGLAPIVAIGIVALGRRGFASEAGWLGWAAVAFGLADALFSGWLPIRGGSRSLGLRLGGLVGLGLAQSVLVWGVAALGGGMGEIGPVSLAILILATLVGLALGLAIVAAGVPEEAARIGFGPLLAVLALSGGHWPAYGAMPPWARAVADANPSRWAFEGILVSGADRRIGGKSGPMADLAERYFPAETLRSGPRAASMALGLMLLGLAGYAGASASATRRRDSSGESPPS